MSEKNRPSLGAELDAWLRQGAKDFHNAVIPAFPDSARAGDGLGTPLNPTPQMVTQELGVTQEPGGGGYAAMVQTHAAKPGPTEEKQPELER